MWSSSDARWKRWSLSVRSTTMSVTRITWTAVGVGHLITHVLYTHVHVQYCNTTYSNTYIRANTHTHTHTRVQTHTHMRANTHTHACKHTHTHTQNNTEDHNHRFIAQSRKHRHSPISFPCPIHTASPLLRSFLS